MNALKFFGGLFGLLCSGMLFFMTIMAGTGPNLSEGLIMMGIMGFITLTVAFISIKAIAHSFNSSNSALAKTILGPTPTQQGTKNDFSIFLLALLVMWFAHIVVALIPFLNEYSFRDTLAADGGILSIFALTTPFLEMLLYFLVLRKDFSKEKKVIYCVLAALLFGLF